jgi:hypothetical protein
MTINNNNNNNYYYYYFIKFLLFTFRVKSYEANHRNKHSADTINYITGKQKHNDNKHKASLENTILEEQHFPLHNIEKQNTLRTRKTMSIIIIIIHFFIIYVLSHQL